MRGTNLALPLRPPNPSPSCYLKGRPPMPTPSTLLSWASFADYGAALEFAASALGEPVPNIAAGDRRTELLLAARARTVERLGWRWRFHALPDDSGPLVSIAVGDRAPARLPTAVTATPGPIRRPTRPTSPAPA
jgi:hypothetical protein